MPSFSISNFTILPRPLRVSAEFLLLSTGPLLYLISLHPHVAMLQYEASDKYVYISSLKGDAAQIEPRPPLVIMAFTN